MAYARPVVTKEENIWVLRLKNANGKTQEYRCASEAQARQLDGSASVRVRITQAP